MKCPLAISDGVVTHHCSCDGQNPSHPKSAEVSDEAALNQVTWHQVLPGSTATIFRVRDFADRQSAEQFALTLASYSESEIYDIQNHHWSGAQT